MSKQQFIPRDISWLSFNARVLQEANDPTVPLNERIKFLGIHSNNLDEFFRVRVAALKRMVELKGKRVNFYMEENPQKILDRIQIIVLQQQSEFDRIWKNIIEELKKQKIYFVRPERLTKEQKQFVSDYFDREVESNIIPLMIEDLPQLPYLRDKSLYLGVVMRKQDAAYNQKYALVEVPSRTLGRFVLLPSKPGEHNIMLLEDVIRFNLPYIFSYLGYKNFDAHVFKVTKDAEIDIDNDISTTLVQKIEKGIKNRRKGKPVRFAYDKEMDAGLLAYLIRRLNLSKKDNIIPGGRIHNFRHFIDFPNIISAAQKRQAPFIHPDLQNAMRVTDVLTKKDILLNFPYHSFASVIDLLREAAMDPSVLSIKITAYRLASNSKIINALINAVRNGKSVTVMLELSARFDEEANLEWKDRLEEVGVKVLLGIQNMKVHGKLCVIKKRERSRTFYYGFVSTGNLNERTAKVYADHCLLTSNRNIMADINRIFKFLENPKQPIATAFKTCKTLLPSPVEMRKHLLAMIDREIKAAKAHKKAAILIKVNSLSDTQLIQKLYEAATAGVEIKMVVRGIFCAKTENKKFKKQIFAVSIVDEYLEHARVLFFHNNGKPKIYLSSADWMMRNLDHRIEAAVPVTDKTIVAELEEILHIQLSDNVKARVLDNALSNEYVPAKGN
ncbi:MAG: polyphosphate kinase 1, partial [Chitinophagaceae bacterium]|nr:polyphosphate kinase 1 [Chitinophagaceae bacterium]